MKGTINLSATEDAGEYVSRQGKVVAPLGVENALGVHSGEIGGSRFILCFYAGCLTVKGRRGT